MSIEKIANSIPVSNFAKKVSVGTSRWGGSISNFLTKHPNIDKFVKKIEPTNHDNAFIPLMTLMVGCVIVPRVITASKRNPDDKQATKDEISEILFRDVQTVTIILFLLKALNAVVANLATKKTGLPMVNKTFEQFKKLANVDGSIFKKIKTNASTIKQNVVIFGKNALSALNPLGGSRALTNAEIVSKYSNFSSAEDVVKMLNNVDACGGNKEKVFNNILDNLIKIQKESMQTAALKGEEISTSLIDELTKIKENGVEKFCESFSELSQQAKTSLKAYINYVDKSGKLNPTAQKAINLNGWMNGGCLLFESAYLGAGLPAINQKRLERKYLKNGQKKDAVEFGTNANQGANYDKKKITKNIKPQEVQLYKSFVKG